MVGRVSNTRSGRAGSLLILLSVLLLAGAGVVYLAQPAAAARYLPSYYDPCMPENFFGDEFTGAGGTAQDELRTQEHYGFPQFECGRIIVSKVTSPLGAPAASFEFDPSWGPNFLLAGGGSFDTGLTLPMGIYSVAEVLPLGAGWSLASASCDDGSSPAAIGLSQGETVTCTFDDHYQEVQRPHGSLEIVKATVPAGGAGFGFDAGGLGTFSLDDGGSRLLDDLAAGAYTVTETPAACWVFESVVCSTVPGAAVDYDVVGAGVTVNLAEGQDVTCTFTNREEETVGPEGSLTIIKRTVPVGGAGFGFDAAALGTFSLDDGGSKTFTDLAAGAYVVTETPAADWEFAQVECDALDYVAAGASVTVNLAEGEVAVCTFTNGELPYTGTGPLTLPLLLAGLATLLMGLGAWAWSWMREADRA